MCQFVEDIYTLVDLIKARTDMTVIYEKDYITNFKDSGYRSYHVIINYPINSIAGYKEIIYEIQIRTLAMNFWATIEHSLKYKYEHYIPKDVAERLRRAADAAFLLDQEMSEIREEIMKAQVDEEYHQRALKATAELQSGRKGYRALLDHILNVSVTDLKKNYERLNVSFELWKGESDAQPYIAPMVDMMKKKGLAYESEGALVVDVQEEMLGLLLTMILPADSVDVH